MAAKESDAMKKARKLVIDKNMTAYAAAAKVGLTRSAIYMAPWYKAFKEAQCKPQRKPVAVKRGSTGTK